LQEEAWLVLLSLFLLFIIVITLVYCTWYSNSLLQINMPIMQEKFLTSRLTTSYMHAKHI